MFRSPIFLIFILIVIVGIARDQPPQGSLRIQFQAAERTFQEAEKISDLAGEDPAMQKKSDLLYQKALNQFRSIFPIAERQSKDSILFLAHIRAGYIQFIFDSSSGAKKDFLQAFIIKEKNTGIPDSLLFTPLVYTGGIFYANNDLDSAMLFFNQAETLAKLLRKPPADIQRLYNRLGVIYYETGNYRQAKIYFEMALSLTPATETSLIANYRINIASLLVKLDELDQARILYEGLLPLKLYSNEIYHNLGIIRLKQNQPAIAKNYFRKVNYINDRKTIDLYYNMAMTMADLNEKDSTDRYLLAARSEVIKWYGNKKNTQLGLLLKFEGDQWMKHSKPEKALASYQDALQQFIPGYNDISPESTPVNFEGVHSYINLFNTLVAKADAGKALYDQTKDEHYLVSSLSSFRSAFRLADHVERTYNSDEARLFLQKIKYAVHNRPIETGLHLFQLTRKKEYLEDVYNFDQQNKASVLSLNRWEKKLRSSNPSLNQLYRQEESLKSLITRFTIRLGLPSDGAGQVYLIGVIRDKEIELNNVQEAIKKQAGATTVINSGQIPSIHDLQGNLDNKTAILSYHLSETALVILLIEGNKFDYKYVPIDSGFLTELSSFQRNLNQVDNGSRYEGHGKALYLFNKLIRPVISELSQTKRLIIIPDDELSYLPFEALEDDHGNYLLQLFSVQYQYASSVIGIEKKGASLNRIISFAPFASRSFKDSSGKTISALPWSSTETINLDAELYADSLATKTRFLKMAGHFPVIHLATHAAANNSDPMLSSILFYPGEKDHGLTVREIYDLDLDSTNLIVLSACETADGKLEKGEGLLSLSRAFAYAGCPNIIASLWKAEDKTTAYISQRLYFYLSRDYKKDEALQMAKIDLINNKEIEGRFKSPRYWAHLMLVGEYEPHHKRKQWSGVAIGIMILLLGYVAIRRGKARLQ
ncbi:MAG: CHAT domain-containing protein [Chitinophagaceae bacterium]|nr:CHAT domain-containing protein [Chitinophagaceae bacterium]